MPSGHLGCVRDALAILETVSGSAVLAVALADTSTVHELEPGIALWVFQRLAFSIEVFEPAATEWLACNTLPILKLRAIRAPGTDGGGSPLDHRALPELHTQNASSKCIQYRQKCRHCDIQASRWSHSTHHAAPPPHRLGYRPPHIGEMRLTHKLPSSFLFDEHLKFSRLRQLFSSWIILSGQTGVT